MAVTNFALTVALLIGGLGASDQETARLRGRVTTLSGDPIQGIKVELHRLIFEKGHIVLAEGELTQSALTDDDGNYNMSGLPWGQYRVVVDQLGFAKVELWRVGLGLGERVLDIGVPMETHGLQEFEVVGTVRKSDRTVLRDATVTLVNAFNLQMVQEARTSAAGTYRMQLIHPGQYLLYASKPKFAVSVTALSLPRGRNKVDLVLKTLGRS